MLVKIKKNFFWCVLTLLLPSASLQWAKDIYLWKIFLRIPHLFDSNFSGIVWIDKLHYFYKGICCPNNDCHRNGKKDNFSAIIATRKKIFIKNLKLIDLKYHWKNWVDCQHSTILLVEWKLVELEGCLNLI